jgi:hypothetical protein
VDLVLREEQRDLVLADDDREFSLRPRREGV